MDTADSAETVPGPTLRATLRRRWGAVLVGAMLGVLLALGYLLLASPRYVSTASVLVTPTAGTDSATPINGQGNRDSVNLDTEAQLVTSADTLTEARRLLGAAASAPDLEAQVTVSVPPNTSVLAISFAAPTAAEAQRGAQAFAEAYLTARGQRAKDGLTTQIDGVDSQIKDVRDRLLAASGRLQQAPAGSVERSIAQAEADVLASQLSALTEQSANLRSTAVSPGRVIVPATLPARPDGVAPLLVAAGGLALGLVLGAALALARDRADTRVRTPADVHRVVGVPVVSLLDDERTELASLIGGSGAPSRGFRRLSNTLTSLLPTGRRAVVVAGAGATSSGVVAVQLAVALAHSGHTVTVVSSEPRTDVLVAGALPAGGRAGLGEVLAGQRALEEVTHPVAAVPGLRWLRAGDDVGDLSARLQSRTAAGVVDALCARSEFVILQAAPAGASTDAQSLARLARAAVIVVEAGRTDAAELGDALVQLRQVNLDDVSCVLAGPRLLRLARRPRVGRRPEPAGAPGPRQLPSPSGVGAAAPTAGARP